MGTADELSPARRRVAESLKVQGPQTARALATRFDLTGVALRQHLQGLEALGLARSTLAAAEGRGRPPRLWSLTGAAGALFPDRHGELTVGLLDAIRGVMGEDGLRQVLDVRGEAQRARYAASLPGGSASLRERVEALAAERSQEGYMAEVRETEDGALLLLEHHCPICEAASACQGLCRVELDVFQAALGEGVLVERVAHLLSGDERCVYRIRARS